MRPDRTRARGVAAAAVLGSLVAAVLAQTGEARRSSSLTPDEGYYLSVATRSRLAGRLDPDLVRSGVAPLPILLNFLPWLGEVSSLPRENPWVTLPGDGGRIAGPRLATTWTSLVPLVALAFAWLYRRRGLGAATLGAGLLAFSPTMLAHASVATQDSSFAFQATLAVLSLGALAASPTRPRLALAALATALAVSAKYSGIVLIPAALLALAWPTARGGDHARGIARGLAFAGLAMAATWALHGFGVVRGDEPSFVAAIKFQVAHASSGHPAFLLGERSTTGWARYFPVAIGLKSTPAELVLLAGLAILPAARLARRRGRPPVDPRHATMAAFLLVLMLALARSRVDIGHRYAIGLYPVAVLLVVDAWSAARPGLGRVAGPALLAAQVATAWAASPDYLAYFNPIAGGSAGGWRALADSNVDWGQGLPALRALIDREGYRRVALDLFGTARPEDYGVSGDLTDGLRAPIGEYDALAVSVNRLHSVYPRGPAKSPGYLAHDCYRDLRALPPAHRAGPSIFVYDLRDPAARRAAESSIAALAAQLRGDPPAMAEGGGRSRR